MEYNVYTRGKNAGKPKTETDRIKRFLIEGLGCTPVTTRSRYKAYQSPATGKLFFVGQASVRIGTCKSKSLSCTDRIYSMMEKWEVDHI